MARIRKKLDGLIKTSKGIALLKKDQKKQLIDSLDSADAEDLESLYQILLDEQAIMGKIEEEFQKQSYDALQEYYATVKIAIKTCKNVALEKKNKKSESDDMEIADKILDQMKTL